MSHMGRSFRPLAGFWFLNGIAEEYVKKNTGTFPSPCGVLVLKFKASPRVSVRLLRGFRPLAGFWFLNNYYPAIQNFFFRFPSPCGVPLS